MLCTSSSSLSPWGYSRPSSTPYRHLMPLVSRRVPFAVNPVVLWRSENSMRIWSSSTMTSGPLVMSIVRSTAPPCLSASVSSWALFSMSGRPTKPLSLGSRRGAHLVVLDDTPHISALGESSFEKNRPMCSGDRVVRYSRGRSVTPKASKGVPWRGSSSAKSSHRDSSPLRLVTRTMNRFELSSLSCSPPLSRSSCMASSPPVSCAALVSIPRSNRSGDPMQSVPGGSTRTRGCPPLQEVL
mmetsp:Transcript_25381/g.62869  ORF Transcript_25381/g.62869 Transcript_25381/m.62869 type:complete len:241 (+) Transcript_25381:803-1525(+)